MCRSGWKNKLECGGVAGEAGKTSGDFEQNSDEVEGRRIDWSGILVSEFIRGYVFTYTLVL